MTRAVDTAAAIALEGVGLRVGDRELLRELSLTIGAGERWLLVGPNGSGKSTLLRAIADLARPARGRVRRPDTPPGMLFQDGALWPHMSVEQHLSFVDGGADVAWRERLLERLQLDALRARRPAALSGGERVRLAIARAFAARPRWVLLDEPLAHLDPAVADAMRAAIPALLDELGATSLTVTHDGDDLTLLGTRMIALVGDGAAWVGDVADALRTPPTTTVALLAGDGAVLTLATDADGRAEVVPGVTLATERRDARVAVFVPAASVALDRGPLSARFVAPDRRGGCWVRVGERLLRSDAPPAGRTPGEALRGAVEGSPIVLADDGGAR